jgi:hypothetical protein
MKHCSCHFMWSVCLRGWLQEAARAAGAAEKGLHTWAIDLEPVATPARTSTACEAGDSKTEAKGAAGSGGGVRAAEAAASVSTASSRRASGSPSGSRKSSGTSAGTAAGAGVGAGAEAGASALFAFGTQNAAVLTRPTARDPHVEPEADEVMPS